MERLAHHESAPPPSRSDDIHDSPWVTLAYLLFVFVPLAFLPDPMRALLASALAIAVFLPLHFGFYHSSSSVRPWLVLAVALVGYGLVPYNPGGNTFLIYACAMAGWSFRPRIAALVAAALVALLAAEFWWVMPTVRLAVAWAGMAAVVGGLVLAGTLYSRERSRRNSELRLTQQEVARLAAMAERERIGRDLHDLLGHTLSLVAIKSELAGRLVDRSPLEAKAQMAEVESVARKALAQVREAVAGIRATGLEAELAAARLALLSAEVRLDQRIAPVALSPEAESVLALGLREAVTNILRHAQAQRVDVELSADAGGVQLLISDDGRGGTIEPNTGLAGMRERLVALGGGLQYDSTPGSGTRLVLSLPRPALQGPNP
ncbi:two-component sensor histidine kinase [Arenimonas soli]|uniref:Two-component sensor histidine kinase n=1 Tax=Arenimonas soli TaxID=2269504 RepID=A0ABQ1HSY4_9GAMM|nr:sensor histidine kinase [Arenimonas soli]GGA86445.1 two-component sensor histidine kinase [Arenimonas soli]